MLLPPGGLNHLFERCPFRALEQFDQRGLLGAFAFGGGGLGFERNAKGAATCIGDCKLRGAVLGLALGGNQIGVGQGCQNLEPRTPFEIGREVGQQVLWMLSRCGEQFGLGLGEFHGFSFKKW